MVRWKKVVAWMLALVMVIGGIEFTPIDVSAETVDGKDCIQVVEEDENIGQDSVKGAYAGNYDYSGFINDSRWSHGRSWGDNKRPEISTWSSIGCCAYVADFVKYIYGSDSLRSSDTFTKMSELRSGDVVWVSGSHWFAVLERTGNTLYTAEGNVDDKVVVSKTRYTISGESFSYFDGTKTAYYTITTGYHYTGGSSSSSSGYTITDTGVTEITETTARINFTVSPTATVKETGFYLGTSESNMEKHVENYSGACNSDTYQLGTGKWTSALSPGTTYYYKMYMILSNGTTVYSNVGTFKTVGKGDTTPPKIYGTYVENLTTEGFKIVCQVSDDSGVREVKFPTWTEQNGQDDITWPNGVETTSGGIWSYYVSIADHNYERGRYITHIYAYDIYGNSTSVGVETVVPVPDTTPPVITDVQVVNHTSYYSVSCTVTDNVGVNRVQFPSWTVYADQDDLQPYWMTDSAVSGTKSGNTYTYNVYFKDHNDEQGFYTTHIYAYDDAGNASLYHVGDVFVGVYNLQLDPNGGSFVNFGGSAPHTLSTKLVYNTSHCFDITSYAVQREGYIFDGWYTAPTGGVQVYSNANVATNEGTYFSNNRYYYKGDLTVYAHWIQADTTPPKIYGIYVENLTTEGFKVVCQVSDDSGVMEVRFPTWTEQGDQDDLASPWPKGVETTSGGIWSYYVNIADHNYERGRYITHIYAYDIYGNFSREIVETVVPVPDAVSPVITNAFITDLDDTGFTVTAYATDDVALKTIRFPVKVEGMDWQWKDGTQNVDGSYSYRVRYSDFGNYEGLYNIDLYAYDTSDNPSAVYPLRQWTRASISVNPIIDGTAYNNGLEGFTFDVSVKDTNGKDVSGEYGAKSVIAFNKKIPTGYTFVVTPVGNIKNYDAKSVSGTVTYNMSPISLIWTIKEFTVSYDANGGTGTPGSQIKHVDEDINISNLQPSRYGYIFIGWNTKPEGKGTTYLPGNVYKANSDATLYAQWKYDPTCVNLIDKATVKAIATQNYTGKAITPAVTVTLNKIKLVEGVDYAVNYENNVGSGTAHIIITGIGEYVGTKTVHFTIKGTPISKAKVTGIVPKTYNGNEQIQENLSLAVIGKTLIEGEDYTVSYTKHTNVGTATVVITGMGEYSGTIKKTFKINAYDIKEDVNHMISVSALEENDLAYTKGGVTPNVVVKFGTTELVKGKDYTISYSNNKAVTKNEKKPFTITIKGKGNFKGSVKQEYLITQKSIKAVTATVGNVTYSKKAGTYISKPVLVDTNGKKLATTDYTVAYSLADGTPLTKKSIVSEGTTVFVTISGKGNYKDSVVLAYQVVAKQ